MSKHVGVVAGTKRLINAFKYSIKGLAAAFRHEQAFRLEIYLSLLLIPMAYYLADTEMHLLFMLMSWFLVIFMELLNSAIEAVVDRIGAEHHELSGRAKDIGSAAVLLAVLQALFVWSTTLWPLFETQLSLLAKVLNAT